MRASMLPIFRFMWDQLCTIVEGSYASYEVTMFLINRLPGAITLLIRTHTNTEVPVPLVFVSRAWVSFSFFSLLPSLLFHLSSSLCPSFLSPPSLPLSASSSYSDQSLLEGDQIRKMGSKGRENAVRTPRTIVVLTEMHVTQPQTVLSCAT